MTARGNLVNLDAMIARADFAAEESDENTIENVRDISLRDFMPGALNAFGREAWLNRKTAS